MSWSKMSADAWTSATVLQKLKKHRASANRFYYSAFSAVTAECRKKKSIFTFGYEHPPHHEVGKEMKKLFTHMTKQDRDDLRDAVKRLYDARIDADYHANVQLGDTEIRNAMRDAQFVLNSLGVAV